MISLLAGVVLTVNIALPPDCHPKLSKPDESGAQILRCGRLNAYNAPATATKIYLQIPLPPSCTEWTLSATVHGKQTLECK